MNQAFISAGSNIEPDRNIRRAIRLLAERVSVQSLSTVYLTEPIGPEGQPFYYNCIVEIETRFDPYELKRNTLLQIESSVGRKRSKDRFAPRPIDLDLLLYDRLNISEGDLVLPHPDILQRPFLILALNELAPDLVLPGTTVAVANVARNLRLTSMKALSSYTALLREELRNGFKPRKHRKPGTQAAG